MPAQIEGVIELQDINYSYNGQAVLQNLNLRVNKGEKVGIIGPSGGGKSTLLKLLPLFIEPKSGTILIDGVDTQSVSLHELRRTIAWVSQMPQLFSGSILENIYDGDVYRKVNVQEIQNAINVANVTEFTVRLPMGIKSPAGENGSSLSGGQRQRIAIARSLIRNAPILCLDEPTAALDAKSENYIRDSLMKIIKDKTVLMVTHRRSLLALMDSIYVLDNGVLTNVNELGGLEQYLQQLEGLNAQRVAREMEDDQWFNSQNVLDKVGLAEEAAQPVVVDTAEYIPDSKQANMPNQPVQPVQPAKIFAIPHDQEDLLQAPIPTPQQIASEVVVSESTTDKSDDDGVVIRLH